MNPFELAAVFERAADRAENPQPVLDDFARWMDESLEQNFRAGGRPDRWVPSQKNPTHTLVDHGDLLLSTHAIVEDKDVLLVAGGEGQPEAKAPSLQYGSTTHGVKRRFGAFEARSSRRRLGVTRGETIANPARPYLLFQDMDLTYFGSELPEYIFSDPVAMWEAAA